MKKPKILGMGTENYPEGRIDSFKISEKGGNWKSIINCLVDFGFSENSILTKVDLVLEHRDYLFLYLNSELKVHISAEESEDFFTVRLDTSLSRSEIMKVIEKYFQFPE